MKILLNGALGRMGILMGELLKKEGEQVVLVDARATDGSGAYARLDDCAEEVDCVVDFSSHLATDTLTGYALRRRLPLVVGTTGQTEMEMAAIRALSQSVPVFKTANLSIGIWLLMRLAREAARVLPQADVEIIEKHHNQKVDVPSGTALMLAEAIQGEKPGSEILVGRHENGRRQPGEIGVHSLRMGALPGTHEAILCTAGQQITIRHETFDRGLFAEGALAAARFLVGCKPGLYDMDDLLGG